MKDIDKMFAEGLESVQGFDRAEQQWASVQQMRKKKKRLGAWFVWLGLFLVGSFAGLYFFTTDKSVSQAQKSHSQVDVLVSEQFNVQGDIVPGNENQDKSTEFGSQIEAEIITTSKDHSKPEQAKISKVIPVESDARNIKLVDDGFGSTVKDQSYAYNNSSVQEKNTSGYPAAQGPDSALNTNDDDPLTEDKNSSYEEQSEQPTSTYTITEKSAYTYGQLDGQDNTTDSDKEDKKIEAGSIAGLLLSPFDKADFEIAYPSLPESASDILLFESQKRRSYGLSIFAGAFVDYFPAQEISEETGISPELGIRFHFLDRWNLAASYSINQAGRKIENDFTRYNVNTGSYNPDFSLVGIDFQYLMQIIDLRLSYSVFKQKKLSFDILGGSQFNSLHNGLISSTYTSQYQTRVEEQNVSRGFKLSDYYAGLALNYQFSKNYGLSLNYKYFSPVNKEGVRWITRQRISTHLIYKF